LKRLAAPLWVFNFGISSSIKKYADEKPHLILLLPESVAPDRSGNEKINYTLKKNICHGYFTATP